jgi:hypothetical protein
LSSAEVLLYFSGSDKCSERKWSLLNLQLLTVHVILATASEASKASDRRHRRIMNSANLIAAGIASNTERTKMDGYGEPRAGL